MDASAFPPLPGGSMPAAGPVVPAAVGYPAMRTGVAQVFDSSHPRNAFAPKPQKAPVTVVSATPAQAIDWSTAGMPVTYQKQVMPGVANAAHLSPFAPVQQAQQIPLDALRSRNAAAIFAPAPPRQVFNQRPQVIQQPAQRGGRSSG